MAKHLYHIPLVKVKSFILNNKSLIMKILNDKEMFIYYRNFGKCFYSLYVKDFLEFYKIDKDITFANQSYTHLYQESFLKNFYTVFALSEFKSLYGNQKEIFYIFIYVLKTQDDSFASLLMSKVFLHFFNLMPKSNKKDYVKIAKAICNNKKIALKESYKIFDNRVTYSLYLDGIQKILLEGLSVKTLRKKAHKKLVYEFLE